MTEASYGEFYNVEYRKLYEGKEAAVADSFANEYRRGRGIFRFLRRRKLLPRAAVKPKMLEVGCGAGGVVKYFAEREWVAKGLDLGREYVDFGMSQHRLDVSVGTIRDVPSVWAPDLVVYSHVLEHVLDLGRELREVHRVLPDDGLLWIEVPGVKSLGREYELDFLQYLQNAHTYHFTLTTLTNLLEKSDFELVAGTEDVRSVFRKARSTSTPEIRRDYAQALRYLNRAERLRKIIPFTPAGCLRAFRSGLRKVLQAAGVYDLARRLYRRIVGEGGIAAC